MLPMIRECLIRGINFSVLTVDGFSTRMISHQSKITPDGVLAGKDFSFLPRQIPIATITEVVPCQSLEEEENEISNRIAS